MSMRIYYITTYNTIFFMDHDIALSKAAQLALFDTKHPGSQPIAIRDNATGKQWWQNNAFLAQEEGRRFWRQPDQVSLNWLRRLYRFGPRLGL